MKKSLFMRRNIVGMVSALMLISSFVYGQEKKAVNWKAMGANQEVSFYEIQKDFNQYWEDKTPGKGQGYKPFKRWEAYMTPRVYPTGDMTLPSTTYQNYMEWQRETKASQSGSTKSSTGNWTSLGPVTKPSGYDSGVGRVDWVRFDPTNSNTMYVGTPDGGLWKTTDGGSTWSTNTDFLPIIGCADLAIDHTNTQTMYLATGNWEHDRRSIGVLKSTNGGATWNATSLSWTATDDYKIRRMIMDPINPLIMLVATNKGIFRTTDGWATQGDALTDMSYDIDDIKFKPGSSSTVYAVGFDSYWLSSDNGASWTLNTTSGLPGGSSNVSRIILGVTIANSAYVYALAGNAENGFKGCYRSTNSGSTFTEMSNINSTSGNILHADAVPPTSGTGWDGGQANHDLAIAISPTDADKITVGGINQWRSTNGGTTWSLFTWWLGIDPAYPAEGTIVPYTHADIQDIQYLPGSSTTMFTTSDGGIYKTTDDGTSWTDLSNGLAIAQQTSIAVSQSETGYYITGLQDIGTIQKESGAWKVINGGDGEDALIRRDNGNFNITSGPNGGFSYSDDKGVNKYGLSGAGKPTADGEWLSPVNQDPVSDALIYIGGWPDFYKITTLWSSNETAPWTTLGNPAGTGNILQFAVAPSSTSTIYAIKINKISKSTNSGTSWTDITGSLPVGSAGLSNLTVSNTDPLKVWVTFSGYSDGNKVFQTTNGGTSWTNISTGLPNLPMTTIVYHNGSADAVYLGADIGVYYRDNSSTEWELFNTGLPNCNVRDLEIDYPNSKLLAATYGRGSWESDFHSGPAVWEGNTDSDWGTATNWNPAVVPDAFTSVLITDVANDPIVNEAPASPATCADLTITSGVLTIAAGKALTVSGKVTNSVGAAGLVIESTTTTIGSLIHSSTGVAGTVKREMTNADWATGVDGWHFLSSPVASQAIDPNFTTAPYDFYYWNEATNFWINFKNTSSWSTAHGSTNFKEGTGYMAAYDNGGTKDFSGSLNVSDVPITGLVISGGTNKSWHLLGNPFSAPLKWDVSNVWELTNIGGVINLWNEVGQSYTPLNNGDGDVIPPTNGFMAQVSSGTGSLMIPASKRTHNAQNLYKSTSYPVVKLFARNIDFPSYQESQIRFNPQATSGYDLEYDGYFLPGYAPQFYSVSNNENYMVNSLPEPSSGTIIPFSFVKNDGVNFAIEATGLETVLFTSSVYLVDNKLNISHNLSVNPVYSFTSEATDVPERFEIHFGVVVGTDNVSDQKLNAYFSGNTLYLGGGDGMAKVGIFNVQGQKIVDQSIQLGGLQGLPVKLPAGVYFSQIVNNGNTLTLKMIVQ